MGAAKGAGTGTQWALLWCLGEPQPDMKVPAMAAAQMLHAGTMETPLAAVNPTDVATKSVVSATIVDDAERDAGAVEQIK